MAERGIRQFIDLGAGLPTQRCTHEVAREVTPDAAVVYTDSDPGVIAHGPGSQILAGVPGTAVIEADFRQPEVLLDYPGYTAADRLRRARRAADRRGHPIHTRRRRHMEPGRPLPGRASARVLPGSVRAGFVRGHWRLSLCIGSATPSTAKMTQPSAPARATAMSALRNLVVGALHQAGRHDTTEATRWVSRYIERPFTILGLTS